MSSQKDPIQSLIVEIDGILQKANSRRPWPVSTDFAHACRVLERVRAYLVFQQQPSQSPSIEPKGQESTSQFSRAVVKEIQSLRANLTQPLQIELEALRRERESLVKEIRLLENRHQHYQSLAQQQAKQEQIISDFLQVLTGSLQESLTQQISNTLVNLEISHSDELKDTSIQHSTSDGHRDTVSITQHASYSRDRLEQLQQMQVEYDRMLINLDSTIRVVLDALQRNVVGYQESLSQGVAKMHSLGQQGEVLFTALVNHLAQQLGREVSYMRTEQIQSSDSPTNSPQAKVRNVNNEPETARSKLNPQLLNTQQSSERESPQQEELVQSGDRDPIASKTAENQLELLAEVPIRENTFPKDSEVVEQNFDNLHLEPINADEIDALLQIDIAALVAESSSQQETDKAPEKPEVTTQEHETSNSVPVSEFISPDAEDAMAVNPDISNELDDLYSVLFGADLNNAVETDEFELLIRGTPSKVEEIEEPLVNPQQSVVDNTLNNQEIITNEYLAESLFEDDIANSDFTSAPPTSASQSSLLASWEDVLFDEDGTDVASNQVVETDFAGAVTEEKTSSITSRSPSQEPEDIDTISALTDLFDEEELSTSADVTNITLENSAIASEFTPDSILSVLESQDERQQAEPDPFLDGVEDRYIPAPIEENLLVTEESNSEPDIKLLLDGDILQQLSEELSVFELLDDRDVRGQEKHPKPEVASTIQTEPLPTSELKPNTSKEVLAEDWDALTLNTSSTEESVNITAPLETEENQDSKTNEATWSQDLLTLEALNWDLEKANPQEETAFSDWTLDEANNNFVMSIDFSLGDSNTVAETGESDEQVQNSLPQTPPLTMGEDASQDQSSNEWDWESESYQIDSLNWDMEEAIAKGEEGFSNWTLEEVANTDFGYSTINFGLVDDVEEPKTSNSDNLNNSQSHPRLEKEGNQDSNSDKI